MRDPARRDSLAGTAALVPGPVLPIDPGEVRACVTAPYSRSDWACWRCAAARTRSSSPSCAFASRRPAFRLDRSGSRSGVRVRQRARRDLRSRSSRWSTTRGRRPSPRLWVLDLERGVVRFHALVAHGRGSGLRYRRAFSNVPGSQAVEPRPVPHRGHLHGRHGYSLRLIGLEPGIERLAYERAIVIHGARVRERCVRARTAGSGAAGAARARPALNRDVIDAIRGGSALFAYYPTRAGSRARAICAARAPKLPLHASAARHTSLASHLPAPLTTPITSRFTRHSLARSGGCARAFEPLPSARARRRDRAPGGRPRPGAGPRSSGSRAPRSAARGRGEPPYPP